MAVHTFYLAVSILWLQLLNCSHINNYCGFIEVYNNGKYTFQNGLPQHIEWLVGTLDHSKKIGLKTVAVFKIKLKERP